MAITGSGVLDSWCIRAPVTPVLGKHRPAEPLKRLVQVTQVQKLAVHIMLPAHRMLSQWVMRPPS